MEGVAHRDDADAVSGGLLARQVDGLACGQLTERVVRVEDRCGAAVGDDLGGGARGDRTGDDALDVELGHHHAVRRLPLLVGQHQGLGYLVGRRDRQADSGEGVAGHLD